MTRYLIILTVLMVLTAGSLVAEGERPGRILFLRLDVESDQATVVRSDIVEGSLKRPRVADTTGEFLFRAFLVDGTEYFSGSCRDPRIKRFEYEDPDRPGVLVGKTVMLEKATLTVRLPYHPELSHVLCARKPATDSEAARGDERISLGRLEIQHDKGGER